VKGFSSRRIAGDVSICLSSESFKFLMLAELYDFRFIIKISSSFDAMYATWDYFAFSLNDSLTLLIVSLLISKILFS
jgi:hypothetical protein